MSESLFRVGGVYRDREGAVVRLDPVHNSEIAIAYVIGTHRFVEGPDGHRYLRDGTDTDGFDFAALIPGELRKVNGEWVSMTPTLDKLEAEKEGGEFGKADDLNDWLDPDAGMTGHDGAELVRRWAEKERARIQREREDMLLMPVGPNEAMLVRDCTEAACLYAEQRQEAERVRAILAAPVSTAKPVTVHNALPSLTRMSEAGYRLGVGTFDHDSDRARETKSRGLSIG